MHVDRRKPKSDQMQIQRSDELEKIMAARGHLLVTGGPGSGKTTASILKAAQVAEHNLRPGQKILFLSFARATVSRVIEAIEYEHKLPLEQKQRINVETYHSFFWQMLKTHGYLLGLPRRVAVLTPPNEAAILSVIRREYAAESTLTDAQKTAKKNREDARRLELAHGEGRICFDFFARFAGEVLHGSTRIRKLVATMYPTIILDEFQDTNAQQWRAVLALGEHSTLLALADPEQRIYDWIGADPERLNHFKEAFDPHEVDFGTVNHRSADTEIVTFGNDLLAGRFQKSSYHGVNLCAYPPHESQAMTKLITMTFEARKRMVASSRKDWSIAILVPTKRMTRLVADALRSPPAGMQAIDHTAVLELEAAILSAEVVAYLMQQDIDEGHLERFIDLVRNYFHGRGGDNPTQTDLNEAEKLQKAYNELRDRQAAGGQIKRNSILVSMIAVYDGARSLELSGDPHEDWLAVRRVLDGGDCARMKRISEDVRNLRLLERGTQLRRELSQDWRDNGTYANALTIIQQAFIRDHFATNAKPETGVIVMNMHKAKGKQFDEVIIFEGWPRKVRGQIVGNPDRIVRGNLPSNCDSQARQNFRVSITRGKLRTTVLTPNTDPCVLLLQGD